MLGRIGPSTAAQARRLATAAATDPAAQWRIITNSAGQALAVARILRRARGRPGRVHADLAPPGPAPPVLAPPGTGLAARVTLTITQDTIREHATAGPGPPASPGPATDPGSAGDMVAAALRTAARALDRAQAPADVDAGGCAHTGASPGYRPPPRLREHVIARDVTCRHPTCGQPAWRADLDHTVPYD